MGTGNRQFFLKLLCGTLLLLAEAGVQGRRMLKGRSKDVWEEGGLMMREVVHSRRLQTAPPYCVATSSAANDSKLQDALDWACGPAGSSGGGVDCSAILQTGTCYMPNSLVAHASYAFDYYYVKQNGAVGSCDFGGLATPTSSDPSSGSCVYPSLGSGVSGSTPPSSNFTTPTGNSNGTFVTPTPGSTSDGMGPRLSWRHVCWSLLLVTLLASKL